LASVGAGVRFLGAHCYMGNAIHSRVTHVAMSVPKSYFTTPENEFLGKIMHFLLNNVLIHSNMGSCSLDCSGHIVRPGRTYIAWSSGTRRMMETKS